MERSTQRESLQGHRESAVYRLANAQRTKRYLPYMLYTRTIVVLTGLMIAIAIAAEVALSFSQRNSHSGFAVPQQNVFGSFSTSFLTSFFPTLLVVPIVVAWQSSNEELERLQPYVMLSNGNVPARDSLLLDYIALDKISALFLAIRRRHWLVYLSISTAIGTGLFQPLAGSVFNVESKPSTIVTTASSLRTISLSNEADVLTPFLSAAGFTDASQFQGLGNPPFVKDGWAAAEFQTPSEPIANSSIAVNTTGILSTPNCTNPTTLQLDTSSSTTYTLTASTASGCSASTTFDPSNAVQQYGVVGANPGSCGSATNSSFAPVMFWFFHFADNQRGQARAVICQPSIQLYDIIATVDFGNNSLTNVEAIDSYTPANNVSGSPINGQAFNAVVFNLTGPNNNSFVQARATATAGSVSGTIFRLASQWPSGLQAIFESDDGFLNLTSQIYTQHLAVSAKSVYFVPISTQLPARYTFLTIRLTMDPLATHALAIIMLAVAVVGLGVHLLHRRARRDLYLAARPGTIASTVALTAHSEFADLLEPFDDRRRMTHKLEGLRFRIDKRTGAIVANDVLPLRSPDAEMMLLTPDLGSDKQGMDSYVHEQPRNESV